MDADTHDGERRVLLAEDTAVKILYRSHLQQAGWTVLLAEDGLKAVEIALTEPLTLILMDLGLPKLGGVEATKRIRAAGLHMPIIALTAEDDSADRRACRDAGMTGFLRKPIGPAALLAEVEKRLSRTRAARNRAGLVRAALAQTGNQAEAPHAQDRPPRPGA